MLDKSIDTINKYSIIYAKKGYFDKQEADKIKKARRLGIDINKSILDDIENSYIIKDLKDEQINLYIGKKQEKVADEITRQEMRELEEIKREITVEVNYDKEPNKEKEEKIRQYIETCNRIYENKKLPKLELQFLEKAIKKVPSSYKDIVRFTKKCINIQNLFCLCKKL